MAFLFGSRGRQKQPAEIVRSLKDLLGKLGEAGRNGGGIGKVRCQLHTSGHVGVYTHGEEGERGLEPRKERGQER